jgi:hypothetical protein
MFIEVARRTRRTYAAPLEVGVLLLCAVVAPLLGMRLLSLQTLTITASSHPGAHHQAPAPTPPDHAEHGPVCFLCVLGSVFLLGSAVKLGSQWAASTRLRLNQRFPARARPFMPHCRSRAPPQTLRS